ncbi:MAG: hypothetical protein ACKVJA_01095 [Flavobacteriales bacterium]
MKKLLFIFFSVTLLFSCVNDKKEYTNNLDHFKNLIDDINTYFIDSTIEDLEISNYYTEDFVFYSYPAGNKKGVKTSKVDYINNLKQMKKMNMSINIGHSIYLPGIDEESHDLDGSVRVYYGAMIFLDTNNVEFSGYQTVNFEEGEISAIWEWTDYGGVISQLNH